MKYYEVKFLIGSESEKEHFEDILEKTKLITKFIRKMFGLEVELEIYEPKAAVKYLPFEKDGVDIGMYEVSIPK